MEDRTTASIPDLAVSHQRKHGLGLLHGLCSVSYEWLAGSAQALQQRGTQAAKLGWSFQAGVLMHTSRLGLGQPGLEHSEFHTGQAYSETLSQNLKGKVGKQPLETFALIHLFH